MNRYEYDIGTWGEALGTYLVSVVFNSEAVKETMRGEGVGSLDLQLKIPVEGPVKTYLQCAVQVKTGPSYFDWSKENKRWRIKNLKPEHVEKWRASNQPVLLLCVRVDPPFNTYWTLVTRNSPWPFYVTESHLLDPAARFELERLLQMHKTSFSQLPKFQTHQLKATSAVRNWASSRYSKIQGVFECPLGKVTLSNYAWRHLTRMSRAQSHIIDSLTVLPYSRHFLAIRPHQIQTISQERVVTNRTITVTRKVLAIYRDIRFSDKGICVVYVRLDERIVYPIKWQERGLFQRGVCQDLRLESIYRKTSK